MLGRIVTTAALTACLLAAPGASAQPGADADEEARALFEAGRVAFDSGRFERALDYFQRAYDLSQRPPLLFNIANVHDRLRNDREALAAFRRYLELMPDAGNAAFARARVEALERRLAAAETAGPPSGATGDPATSGDDGSPADASTGPGDGAVTSPPPEGGGGDATPGIALLVAGGALTLAAVGTTVWWVGRNDLIDQCNQMGCANGPTLVGERDAAAGVTIALGVVGITGIVVGAALLASSGGGGESEAAVSCAPAFGGVACAGRF